MKIYKKGNYIYLVNASGDIKQDHANEVKITKTNVANETYSIYSDDLGVNNVTFSELTQENGTAYASVSAFELWYAENTGFNPASGGSGAGTVINTVSNYASLPDATLVSNDFYWVSSTQGYRILGTYKSNGLYYSNGTSWEYIDAPTTATQSEVNTGTLTDKYLTPSTFENATKWTTKVPYTGATSDVNLGEFGVQLGNLEFDNTPTDIPTTVGSMVWNDTDGTLDLKLKGGNVTLQVGQEQVLRVVNKTYTNVTLSEANYQAVRVTGSQGQRLKVDLAQATNDLLSAETIGLVTENILNNQEGFITTSGLVRGINTTGSLQSETWLDGDIVYLSPTTAGNITNIKPIAPNHLIIIGYVVSAHITQGTIFVKVDNGYELDELHNVKIDSGTLANNDIIQYNSSTLLWENKQPSVVGGSFIPSHSASDIPGGYYSNNGSATFSVLGNVSTAALSGTASGVSITNTNNLTRTIRTQIPTSSTAGSKASIRTASLRYSVGQGFSFSVGWCIQDASFVTGAKQFHGLLPTSTLSTINNLVDVSSLVNFIGVGSDASDLNLQIFYNDASGVASQIDLGSDFPANRTVGASLNAFYFFDLYNEPNTTEVKYRITNRETGITAQGTLSTDLPDVTTLLACQSIRTNGASALATVTQWSHLIGYAL
jgi:hypothetical protein